MKSKLLSFLVVFCITLGLSTPVDAAQGADIRIRVSISIKVMIKITYTGTYRSSSSSSPSEYRLTPQDVESVPGKDGSSVDISWSAPLNGAPSKGYEVQLFVWNRSLLPDTSGGWSELKYKVASNVNVLQVNDLEPSRIYDVMVKAIDGYGEHRGEPTRFCSPSFSTTDLGCIFDISASKGTYIPVPESKFDSSSSFWDLPDNGPKTGSINVSWSPAKNARSYVVQWDGHQSPRDFGEKTVPSSQNSTLITGLPGSHLYIIRVLAIGLDGLYSESFSTRAFASPSSSTGPDLSGGKGECNVPTGPFGGGPWVLKEFIRIGITPQAVSNGQSDYLKTEAFLTRFRKNGETLWKNADAVLIDKDRCLEKVVYPNNKEDRAYFLPDLVSDFEFQVAEVSATPSGGRAVGDWSISIWFGPNRTALNRSELDKRTPLGDSTRASDAQCYSISTSPERLKCLRIVDEFMTKGTSASARFIADSAYRDSIERLQLLASQAATELKAKQEAEAKAAAELKTKQEAEAKAAAELKTKQEAEAKAAAELKAKQDAEAKAAAELKAKQEAEAKAAAELKAKQEAEAKAAAELKAKQEAEAKAAAELKAKQEAEAKAAAELKAKQEAEAKAAADKIIQEAERILAAAKAAATKKTTITCTKGKLIKKVTAVKPKCPAGYKKK